MDEPQRSKKAGVLPSNTNDPRFVVDDEGPSKLPAEWNDRAALWADFTLHLGVGRELDALKLELAAFFKLVGALFSMVGRAVQGLATRRNR